MTVGAEERGGGQAAEGAAAAMEVSLLLLLSFFLEKLGRPCCALYYRRVRKGKQRVGA